MSTPRSAARPLYDFCVAAPHEHEPTDATIYVNWVRIGMAPYDLKLDLGFRANDDPPAEFPVRAVMSWEHAKELHVLLGDAIDEYEQEVGEIRDFGIVTGPAREVPDPPKRSPELEAGDG